MKEGAPAPWTRKPAVSLQVAYPTQWIAGVTKLPGHRPGLSAVAETRMGMVQYLPDEPVVGDAIAWYGEYLQAQVDFLSTQVATGSTVMEVEAGIGLHALALSRMVGPQGHVMLYESDVVKRQILEQNLEVHGVRNATLMRRRIGGVPEAEPVAGERDGVPQHETLDDLQVERLDWLKVNGGRRALEVLAGGEETIWRLRPRVLVAMTEAEGDEALVAELQQRLLDLGYQCHVHASALFVATISIVGKTISSRALASPRFWPSRKKYSTTRELARGLRRPDARWRCSASTGCAGHCTMSASRSHSAGSRRVAVRRRPARGGARCSSARSH